MADDRYEPRTGEFGFIKQFDTLTFPKKLQPLRGMTDDSGASQTKIGNIIVSGSTGLMYGVGEDPSNPGTSGKLWRKPGYGSGDAWASIPTNNQLAGGVYNPNFLVDYPDAGNARTIYWAAAGTELRASDPTGASSSSQQNLTYASIGQGLVHPKDKNLYIPYRTTTTPYIAVQAPNATVWSGFSATAFQLPMQYRVYNLSYYGDYLAIPCTSINAGSDVLSNIVYLSNRDTSQTTFAESIPWGAGFLKVLNNLGGVLVGISETGSDTLQPETTQDYNSIVIRIYQGGTESEIIKEIKAVHLTNVSGGRPSVSINPRVNFIHAGRLYFSVNINPNDTITPARYGLWSVGKNKLTGEWSVQMERIATNANTETSVIAAAAAGDYFEMVHTADGTIAKPINGQTNASTYGATSIYESGVNPNMDEADKLAIKKLYNVRVNCQPLLSGAQIVLKYRTDSNGADSDWITAYTYATTGGISFDAPLAGTSAYTDGRNFEFRLESTGGAVILPYGYSYALTETQV